MILFGRVLRNFVACLALLLPLCAALEFEMQSQLKCIYEEINANVLVVGDWSAHNREVPNQYAYANLRVEDPNKYLLHEKTGGYEGQFAFTTKVAGEYTACFTVADSTDLDMVIHTPDLATAYQTKIKLDWKTGVAATDWDSIAKREHLDALTVELRKLEDAIREVYSEMLQLQSREQEMRNISEETNARVAWFSIASLAICILSGVWQLWYLRRFFQRKKLL